MAKPTPVAERTDGDVWTDGDGITWRQVFGQAQILSVEGGETIALDEGRQIDWKEERTFVGKFLGTKIVPDVEGMDGTKKDVTLLLLESREGERLSCWAGYQLEEAAKKLVPSCRVAIEYVGEKEFGKRGQTMQAFNIHKLPA